MTERLTRGDKSAAVAVLASAFYDYPVMRYILSHSGSHYEEHLQALIGFFCETRLTRDYPLLGIKRDNRLAAVAGINEPIEKEWPEELHQVYRDLSQQIGKDALDRMEQYDAESARFVPEAKHYFLGIIGVLPEFQKRGYARLLLEELQNMSEADPLSGGVCLSTEDVNNVEFYTHMGYKVIGEADVGTLHTWCMFRTNSMK